MDLATGAMNLVQANMVTLSLPSHELNLQAERQKKMSVKVGVQKAGRRGYSTATPPDSLRPRSRENK